MAICAVADIPFLQEFARIVHIKINRAHPNSSFHTLLQLLYTHTHTHKNLILHGLQLVPTGYNRLQLVITGYNRTIGYGTGYSIPGLSPKP